MNGTVVDVGVEGYLTPNDDYEKTVIVLDELDKGASKRELARSLGMSRSTVRRIAENRERYTNTNRNTPPQNND